MSDVVNENTENAKAEKSVTVEEVNVDGTTVTKVTVDPSKQGAIRGATAGAAAGLVVAGPTGAFIGGAVGGLVGLIFGKTDSNNNS